MSVSDNDTDRASGRGEIVLAAGLVGVGLYMLLSAQGIPVPPTDHGPGPRVFPYAVGAGLALVGLWLVVAVLRGDRAEAEAGEDIDLDTGTSWTTLGLLAAILVGYVLLLEPLGYLLATILFFGGVAWTLGSRNWRLLLLISIVLPLVVFLLFTRGLGIYVPNGLLQAVI
ncbi:tripartite tricarboxylate transporter TctB family protein [Ornithinimicrobium cavernae]|uniref:tripartite tricarboxylate transporter TctB family protein n=1 Tax=Ornithinimicrobium cavernae TaxID=2666047 RepID=UPI0012B17419|nr:tripartite tricarboxylate transporter TctB family protein [Ornithinimicrobium cavernae]